MDELLEIFWFIFNTVVYVAAVVFCIWLFAGYDGLRLQVEDSVHDKYNVYESVGEYEEQEDIQSAATVLYDVANTDSSLDIIIDGYIVTDIDRHRLKIYNDASNIVQHINSRYNYKKEYEVDNTGKIVRIRYTPTF